MFLLTCKIPPLKPMLKFFWREGLRALETRNNYTKSVWKITERLHKQLELQIFCPLAELTWLELKLNIFCTKKIKKK